MIWGGCAEIPVIRALVCAWVTLPEPWSLKKGAFYRLLCRSKGAESRGVPHYFGAEVRRLRNPARMKSSPGNGSKKLPHCTSMIFR